jgi:hypothetical protein
LCIGDAGECQERSASNRSKKDIVHGVTSRGPGRMPVKIPIRTLVQRSVKFPPAQNNPKAPRRSTEEKDLAGGELSSNQAVTESTLDGGAAMRVFAVATVLLLSSSLVPSFAQNEGKSPALNQPQTTPVQPELTPQQSDQAKEQNRQRADDTRVNRDWRAQQRDGENMERTGQNDAGRMRDMDRDMDRDRRTVGRSWRMHPDDDRDRADREGYGRGYYDEDRPQRRVKICVEYENGDEYCHYR